jgi:DNA-binding transcriptional MerR regulator
MNESLDSSRIEACLKQGRIRLGIEDNGKSAAAAQNCFADGAKASLYCKGETRWLLVPPQKNMAAQANRKQSAQAAVIPDRLYFKIGDVARICGVETYVLRFWETQFPQLKPNKSGTGQRLYRRNEVELALAIKQLVHAEGYTIAGARQTLEQGGRRRAPKAERLATAEVAPSVVQADSVTSVLAPVLAPAIAPVLAAAAAAPAMTVAQRDQVAATIGHARAELRELLELLSTSAVKPATHRKARVTAMPIAAGSLFPL